jgi:hypothetical protein
MTRGFDEALDLLYETTKVPPFGLPTGFSAFLPFSFFSFATTPYHLSITRCADTGADHIGIN